MVNFTNPMPSLTWALNKYSKIKSIGLCYGVTFYQHYLADMIGADFEKTWSKAVGVNHFSWITDFTYEGKDAWPLVRAALEEKPEVRKQNPFTWELFETFGAFPTVGDGHICEFIPGMWRENAYYGKTPGKDTLSNYFQGQAVQTREKRMAVIADQAYGRAPLNLIDYTNKGVVFRDEELFIDILAAALGVGKPVERTVNLPNKGIICDLPPDAILEVTAFINSSGFHPYHYGTVPPGILNYLRRITASHALTVEASISGDRNMVLQALMSDSVALTRADAIKMADLIFETHGQYLKHFNV
jgi:alpha-galactosidase